MEGTVETQRKELQTARATVETLQEKLQMREQQLVSQEEQLRNLEENLRIEQHHREQATQQAQVEQQQLQVQVQSVKNKNKEVALQTKEWELMGREVTLQALEESLSDRERVMQTQEKTYRDREKALQMRENKLREEQMQVERAAQGRQITEELLQEKDAMIQELQAKLEELTQRLTNQSSSHNNKASEWDDGPAYEGEEGGDEGDIQHEGGLFVASVDTDRIQHRIVSFVDDGSSSSGEDSDTRSARIYSNGDRNSRKRQRSAASDTEQSRCLIEVKEGESGSSSSTSDSEESGAEVSVKTRKRSRSEKATTAVSRSRMKWTDSTDARLTEGVQLHGTKVWAKVAEHVGGGVTGLQCKSSWSKHGKLLQQGLKRGGDWIAEDEQATLPGLAEQHSIGDDSSSNMFTIKSRLQRREVAKVVYNADTDPSSSDDHRHPHSRKIDGDGVKGGDRAVGGASDSGESEDWSDTSEEEESSSEGSDSNSDAATKDSEGEGEKPNGVEITRSFKKSSRSASSGGCAGGSDKVTKAKKPREVGGTEDTSRVYWNDDMDSKLTEGVKLHGNVFAKVAKFVGGGVTGVQCNKRWNLYLKPLQMGLKKGGDWTEDELVALPGLVEQHTIKPYLSDYYKVMTKERIDWQTIGQELRRVPLDCKHKWNSTLVSKMKKGAFTAEEDDLIRQRVAEWGDKGMGLWSCLEKEMGRSGANINMRWRNSLSKK